MFNRIYDERYYLDENREKEIKELLDLQSIWNDGINIQKENYSSLLKEYNSFIKTVTKLIDELSFDKDTLIKLNIITKLIYNGLFSYEQVFTRNVGTSNILECSLGLNVINGVGSCRHVAEFISDVIPNSKVLTCLTECKKPFTKEADHMINLGEYDKVYYGFDAFNGGRVLEFHDDFKIIPVDESIDTYFNYKPYAEIIFYKRSFEEIKIFLRRIKENERSLISVKDEMFIEQLTTLSLETKTSKSIINDFRSDTRENLDRINEQIKIKRLFA